MIRQRTTRKEFLHLVGLTAGALALQACAKQTSPLVAATKPVEEGAAEDATPTQLPPTPTHTQTLTPTPTNEPVVEGPSRFELFQTEVRNITSSLVGREYELGIYLPESYPAATKPYPVLYLLDSDLLFGMAAGLMPLLNMIDGVPQMIIVGIGYNIQSITEWGIARAKDLSLPGIKDAPYDAKADLFFQAMKQEIIPFIEANYRADPGKRILYGYSFGGFFTLYSLLNEPDLFRFYMAGSPETDFTATYLPTHDEKLVSRESNPPIGVYLSVGGKEAHLGSAPSTFNELVEAIQTKNYPGMGLIADIYADEVHGAGGAALTYLKGLRNYS